MNLSALQKIWSIPTSSCALTVRLKVVLCEGFEGLTVTVSEGNWSPEPFVQQSSEQLAAFSVPAQIPSPHVVVRSSEQSVQQAVDASVASQIPFPHVSGRRGRRQS